MVKYSNRAKKGYSLLNRYYNDIEVYVEDDTCKNMWVAIINSVLEGIAIINTVTPLESKYSVIDECKKDEDYSYPKIYIIDGDFDFIFEEPLELDRLFRLNVYCVENLLFSKKAILEVAFQSDVDTSKIEIEEKLCFNELVNELRDKFRELFINYLIIQSLSESIENVGINLHKFSIISKKCIKIIKEKIDNYINKNNTYLNKKYGSNHIIKIRQDVEKKLSQKKINILQIISGKNYLIPYVYHFLQIKFNYKGTKKQLKVILSKYSNFEIEPNFKSSFKKKCEELLKNTV